MRVYVVLSQNYGDDAQSRTCFSPKTSVIFLASLSRMRGHRKRRPPLQIVDGVCRVPGTV